MKKRKRSERLSRLVFFLLLIFRDSLTLSHGPYSLCSIDRSIDPQEEEAKTRGTPVTAAKFMGWRAAFLREQAAIKARADEEKLAKMTFKEREEWKRTQTRLTGRQLFEKGGERFGEEDVEKDADADAREVDVSLFERVRASEREDAEEEKGVVVLYDSD